MGLIRVEIERFRGIKSLDWIVNGKVVCLIGPGDSTKTTILDAIELALSPRWSIPFDDTDFFGADTTLSLSITVTIGDLPAELLSNRKFGHHTRGWLAPESLHDEPQEGDEVVLSIRLSVSSSLEPTWAVVNGRDTEGVRIGAEDREKLGCMRLGEDLDRHFSWARGSVVAQLTGKGTSIAGVLAEAARAARDAVAKNAPPQLKPFNDAAAMAQRLGGSLGVQPRATYQARLDTTGVSLGSSGLSLHEGDIPVRRAGAGTRRLLAVAIQRDLAKTGGLTLIDEVEHGLEPHRLRHLLRELRDGEGGNKGHVVMTTHAPIALGELDAMELRIVRCVAGVTTVQLVGSLLQPIVRKSAEAFLARKVVVCEGKTEL
ncbi:MAG: ATP-binding protein, partial [Planctomycetes bacterium]|nr:ATP-binding protein [Planctomycetota bacterium]